MDLGNNIKIFEEYLKVLNISNLIALIVSIKFSNKK